MDCKLYAVVVTFKPIALNDDLNKHQFMKASFSIVTSLVKKQ